MIKKIIIFLVILFSLLLGLKSYYHFQAQEYAESDHFDGRHFRNQQPVEPKGMLDMLRWQLTSERASWPEWVEQDAVHALPTLELEQQLVATFINHATFYLQLPGLQVITDPIYSLRASPISVAGPKRVRPPGQPLEALPGVDVVLISHNHYDHLDLPSLRELEQKFNPLFLVPLGVASLLKREGIQQVQELDWWESIRVKDYLIHLTPAQHWSTRNILDRNKTLWGSFMLSNEQGPLIYFAGDTGHGPHFKKIQERLGSPLVALLPIGAYEPRWFMRDHHINPEEAVLAHLALEAKVSLGMHFGTFQLTDEAIEAPVEELAIALKKYGVSQEHFRVPAFGQSISF
jgi:L-ascorbate metabolism protein UlaG (beta-lactamase superfamily)